MHDEALDRSRLLQRLTGSEIGHTIRLYDRVTSTMTLAHTQAAAQDTASGVVIVAEEQTQGRGRYARQWLAPHGQALLMTLILKPPHLPTPPTRIAMIAGLAVVQAVARVEPELADAVTLKWPNDVLLIGSAGVAGKVAGILTETSYVGPNLTYALVGLGINVNQPAAYLTEMDGPGIAATSLSVGCGHPIDRTDLLAAICTEFAALLHAPDVAPALWRRRLYTLGRPVTVSDVALIGRQWHGTAVDVDDDGNLVLQGDDGLTHRVSAGDVTLRG